MMGIRQVDSTNSGRGNLVFRSNRSWSWDFETAFTPKILRQRNDLVLTFHLCYALIYQRSLVLCCIMSIWRVTSRWPLIGRRGCFLAWFRPGFGALDVAQPAEYRSNERSWLDFLIWRGDFVWYISVFYINDGCFRQSYWDSKCQ